MHKIFTTVCLYVSFGVTAPAFAQEVALKEPYSMTTVIAKTNISDEVKSNKSKLNGDTFSKEFVAYVNTKYATVKAVRTNLNRKNSQKSNSFSYILAEFVIAFVLHLLLKMKK